jgi:hypothetical protein
VGFKKISSQTGRHVVVDTAQDSDEENGKVCKVGSKKDPTKDKDGYDHARLYFFPPGESPKQVCFI